MAKLKVISGRGDSPQMNWGVTERSEEETTREFNELKKFIGKQVILSGGGGSGLHMCFLDKVELVEKGLFNKPSIRAYLSKVNPPIGSKDTFTPWINSWQLSEIIEE